MSELGVLLKMLDKENLSTSTQEKKTSVWNLLQQIQPSGGERRMKSLFQTPGINFERNKTQITLILGVYCGKKVEEQPL